MHEHLTFLAAASRVLGASLDYRETIRSVARLVVPYLADWSVIDLVEEDGRIARLAVVAAEPADPELVRLMFHYGPDPEHPRGVSRVVGGGGAERIAEVTRDRLARAARSPEHLDMLERLAPRSYLCVPLYARGQVIGSWMLLLTREGRVYSEIDQALAEELGCRAAMAVDNARQYEAARAARAQALVLARRSEILDRASRELSGALTDDEIVNKIMELALSSLADACSVHWVQPDGTLKRLQTRSNSSAAAEVADSGVLAEVVATGRPRLTSSAVTVPLRARGRVAGVLVCCSTGQRRYDEVELALAQDLADRAALALENALLFREAADACRSRDTFIATVSHELRTPLAAVLMWAQLLKLGRFSADETEHAVDAILSSGRAQSQLIDDLLDVSRFTAGKLHVTLATTELLPLIKSAIDQVSQTAAGRWIRLSWEIAPEVTTVCCDGPRLVQVMVNLLANAIKFTPEGGKVRLTARRLGDSVEVSVVDTGVGISPEFLPHVFDRFRQAQSDLDRNHGGLGLGLTIVRQIMELHGGEVVAESAGRGKGASFSVRLAAGNAAGLALPVEAPVSPSAALEGVRVLVVDDEPAILEVVAVMLEGQGAQVTRAPSAAGALRALACETPHLIVSDIAMPGADGYTLIREVRRAHPTLPAVALTALAREEDRLQALRAGFSDHVSKPVEMDALIATLAALVQPSGPLSPTVVTGTSRSPSFESTALAANLPEMVAPSINAAGTGSFT